VRRLWLPLAAAASFLLASIEDSALAPKHDLGTFLIDPPTPYTHYLPPDVPKGKVLAVHGLDVSREVMSFISAGLADGGFEVYAIDLPGHGASRAKFQTAVAEQAIRNVAAALGETTVVLGHSLGAGLLLDLSANHHFSTMVLLSPPPVAIDEIRADRVLIATGAIDLPRIRSFVPIAADIGGTHVETWTLPWAAHSAAILNPVYVGRIVEWLGGNARRTRTLARMAWLVVMFVAAIVLGIELLTVGPSPSGRGRRGSQRAGAPGEGGAKREPDRAKPQEKSNQTLRPLPYPLPEGEGGSSPRAVLIRYIAACGSGLIILKLGNPLGWLRLFGTDYLIGFIFLTGLFLTVAALCARREAVIDRPYSFNRRAVFRAAAAAAYVIVVLGLLVSSHVLNMSLSGNRWWRFPVIFAAGLPFFASDEWMIRHLEPRWKCIGVALLTRGLLLAFLLAGVLILNRENVFLVLIAPLITLFWIGLWFAAGVVYKSTSDPYAAGIFSALVQGWAFAAWFVIL